MMSTTAAFSSPHRTLGLVPPAPADFVWAHDAVLRAPLTAPIRGAEAIQRYQRALQIAFSEARTTVCGRVSQAGMTAVEWEFTGIHVGPMELMGGMVPPTDRPLKVRGASFFRCTPDGLVAEERRYFDVWSVLDQLGL
jgi:SnoaL-like polyketide cyclase